MTPATRALVACLALLPLTATAAPRPAAPAGKPKPARPPPRRPPTSTRCWPGCRRRRASTPASARRSTSRCCRRRWSARGASTSRRRRASRATPSKPIASVMIIDGNQLQFGNADGQESMNLGTNPVARLFADAFVMLLSGNRAGLEKIFKMQLTPKTGSARGEWKLVLTPRVAPMDKMIKELELRGRGLEPERARRARGERRLDAHDVHRRRPEPPLQRRRAGEVLHRSRANDRTRRATATRLRLGDRGAARGRDDRLLRAAPAREQRHHALPPRRHRPPAGGPVAPARRLVADAHADPRRRRVGSGGRARRRGGAGGGPGGAPGGRVARTRARRRRSPRRSTSFTGSACPTSYPTAPRRRCRRRSPTPALDRAARALKQQMAQPLAPMFARLAPSDPLQWFPAILRRFERARAGSLEVDGDQFVTPDRRHAIIFLGTRHSALDSAAQRPLLAEIRRQFDDVEPARGRRPGAAAGGRRADRRRRRAPDERRPDPDLGAVDGRPCCWC